MRPVQRRRQLAAPRCAGAVPAIGRLRRTHPRRVHTRPLRDQPVASGASAAGATGHQRQPIGQPGFGAADPIVRTVRGPRNQRGSGRAMPSRTDRPAFRVRPRRSGTDRPASGTGPDPLGYRPGPTRTQPGAHPPVHLAGRHGPATTQPRHGATAGDPAGRGHPGAGCRRRRSRPDRPVGRVGVPGDRGPSRVRQPGQRGRMG